jgi:hypothetical protein
LGVVYTKAPAISILNSVSYTIFGFTFSGQLSNLVSSWSTVRLGRASVQVVPVSVVVDVVAVCVVPVSVVVDVVAVCVVPVSVVVDVVSVNVDVV